VRAKGKVFCAGADLSWMKRTSTYTREQNLADANVLGEMLSRLNRLPFPTIALVQGTAFGGGVGLVSCCDVAVGVSKATFTLSEVKLGILPATISPYVIARIGAAQARRYFLTAEKISAPRAKEIGLLHEVVETEAELEAWAASFRDSIMVASPSAVAASKDLIRAVAGTPITSDLIADTARRLADQRASPEGVEGLTAFFEKRPPVSAVCCCGVVAFT
jgi:methylglutaconyl-CoA hydratase